MTDLTISGDFDAPRIELSNAANLNIDGRGNQSGSEDLAITNSSTENFA